VDIRRTVASWALLALVAATVVGWIVQRLLGRDPLAGAPDKVKPLPPAVGMAVFGATILLGIAFFSVGDRFFGPLATRKVNLLMDSARSDDAAGIERAIASGVFIDVRDGQDSTALMEAARHGASRAAQAMLRAQASPDLRSGSNKSALDLAIHGGHEALALQLIDAKADISAGGSHGRTPLYLAARVCAGQVLKRLLALGADVAQKDDQGWTPLMAASASGKSVCVRDLLAAGADPSVALPDGRRAADIAMAMAAARPPGQMAEEADILRLLRP
jgi:ankyrin repeat protein